MAVGSPSTVLRRQLGRELRRLREESKVSSDRLAEQLGCSKSRISRIETAQVKITPGAVHEILDVIQVGAGDRARLVQMAKDAEHHAWWHEYDLSKTVVTYYALESEAATLRSFEPTVIHGLLQSAEYTRAVTRHWEKDDAYAKAMVESRQRRRSVLERADSPLDFHLILDEACIRRRVGGEGVLKGQLEFLLNYAKRPNIHIQIVPFSRGMHSAPAGPFNILSFRDRNEPKVVYIETSDDKMLVERRIEAYEHTFGRLCGEALSQDESLGLIRTCVDSP